ncbi:MULTISPECIES: DUF4097 family beta strand repeat-containing protein [unclassified Lysinibacillus]|uniref:DUF4097 family beta strand repeat-containing protein n=1 Tax=unclassified Lysinibacillus TaxID=2636778 RepID=UPI00201167D3|nr:MULTISPECIES: DUF4097 family beta strand repeat-containing protein [unclassified Lysinibacillus]MCL1696476.1 DUF4097 domain-containing protein [Lysinibacillus sp. BPa_S21]MCL1699022.1 DUF4097 domain-containing protein [Lysinibacillus sp. Bpr_S20]
MTSRHTHIAITMIAFGILLALVGYFSGGKWSFVLTDEGIQLPQNNTLINNTYKLDDFTNLKVINTYGDVEIIASDRFTLETNVVEEDDVTYSIKDHTLTVETKAKKKKGFEFGFGNFRTPSIKIYVPSDVKLKNVVLDSNFGDTIIRGLHYQELNLIEDFGDIIIKDTAGEKTEITQSFGDMKLQQFSSNGFVAESEHGDIIIDGTLNGSSTITSNFGDAILHLQNKKSELGYELQTDFGDLIVDKKDQNSKVSQSFNGDNQLKVNLSYGDLQLTLK